MTHKNSHLRPKIALYEPDIPQNTAAIIRTCACLGADLEIIEPCGFLLSDKRFKRVVMDYMDEKMIKFYSGVDEFLKVKSKERIILLTTKASKSYTSFKFKINDTLLFGRESAGVPKKIHEIIKNKLKIPMMKKKRSLNIASSVAIVLAENLRQNKFINHG
jgi:tRNA (cytidine/uridine-2'-O-)-methyltransferase